MESFDSNNLSPFCLTEQKLNVVGSYMNEDYHLTFEEVSFEVLSIKKEKAFAFYFDEELGFVPNHLNDDYMLVFLEKTTPYYFINNGLLFVEVSQMLGVTEEDIRQKSNRFLEYKANLSHLKDYQKILKRKYH